MYIEVVKNMACTSDSAKKIQDPRMAAIEIIIFTQILWKLEISSEVFKKILSAVFFLETQCDVLRYSEHRRYYSSGV